MSYSLGELDFFIARLDDTLDQIHRERAGFGDRAFALKLQLVAERHAHPGGQFFHDEGLGDEIISAQFKCLDDACLIGPAR